MRTLTWAAALLALVAPALPAQQRAWDSGAIKECDRACLIGIIDGYMNAVFKRDVCLVPLLAKDMRMTENTGQITVGEGLLWRSRTEPTSFLVYVADPVAGQVALQTRLKIQGRDTLVAVRLKIDRGTILEIEQLYLGNIAPQAIELLTTPRSILTEDIPANLRVSRQLMVRAAESYFDALEGDSGKIGAFARECVRHENGYRTANNAPPGGRLMPAPVIPDAKTDQGREQLRLSMMTCAEQIDAKLFIFMTRIRPRRTLIVDEQKGLVATLSSVLDRVVNTWCGAIGRGSDPGFGALWTSHYRNHGHLLHPAEV